MGKKDWRPDYHPKRWVVTWVRTDGAMQSSLVELEDIEATLLSDALSHSPNVSDYTVTSCSEDEISRSDLLKMLSDELSIEIE